MRHGQLKKTHALTDTYVESVIDFAEGGEPVLLCDTTVKGLQLRVGKRKNAWQFYHERRDHGSRIYRCEALGFFDRGLYNGLTVHRSPDHMNVEAARTAALIWAGKVAEGTAPAGKRSGVKFEDTFADYLDYLERKAASRGKAARWAKNVKQLGSQLLLPKWTGWTLSEMSDRPDAVADWHRDAVKIAGPTSANHAARVIRALYKRRAKRDLTLSKVNIPTGAVEMHTERGEKKGMAAKDFPKWFAAWRALESPIRRAYHMVNLLTGARPGELARTSWQDHSPEAQTLTIGDAKAGNDIAIPTTPAIRDALRLARKAQPDAKPEDLIFPGCEQAGHRQDLPARGHGLRRSYKTIATAHCKVPDDVSAFLMGHVPEGMSPKYLLRWAFERPGHPRSATQNLARDGALAT